MTVEEMTLEEKYEYLIGMIEGCMPNDDDVVTTEKLLDAYIPQFKKKVCKDQVPTDAEIDKARKQKWDEYYHSEAWGLYSNGFMDAISWMKNRLTKPE